ncbi:MAG: DUF4249 domain-containing protein [Bacteroidota bacterium]
MHSLLRVFASLLLLGLVTNCADPVTPQFRFEAGFLLIEGRITDTPGFSEIRVSRNEVLFGNYTLVPIPGSVVSSIDNEGQEVMWAPVPASNAYRPPADWTAEIGREYHIRVITPEGEMVESTPERLPASVPLLDARVEFEQEAYFSTTRDRFVPAFRLLTDLEDPADEKNFYQFNYSIWQTIDVCASCERARWRDGVCIPGPDTRFVPRWDYLCDAECWVTAQGEGRNVLSDKFFNGNRIENVEAGRYDYDRPGGLLFVVEQYSITEGAFEFGEVLEDLAEGGSGLNAPLPAALVGNLTDLSENKTNVLGYVGTAAVNTERVFINRDTVQGQSLPFDGTIRLEPVRPSPPLAPCEGGTRTRVRPVGWPE